jgi:hypothetical protein
MRKTGLRLRRTPHPAQHHQRIEKVRVTLSHDGDLLDDEFRGASSHFHLQRVRELVEDLAGLRHVHLPEVSELIQDRLYEILLEVPSFDESGDQ